MLLRLDHLRRKVVERATQGLSPVTGRMLRVGDQLASRLVDNDAYNTPSKISDLQLALQSFDQSETRDELRDA